MSGPSASISVSLGVAAVSNPALRPPLHPPANLLLSNTPPTASTNLPAASKTHNIQTTTSERHDLWGGSCDGANRQYWPEARGRRGQCWSPLRGRHRGLQRLRQGWLQPTVRLRNQ